MYRGLDLWRRCRNKFSSGQTGICICLHTICTCRIGAYSIVLNVTWGLSFDIPHPFNLSSLCYPVNLSPCDRLRCSSTAELQTQMTIQRLGLEAVSAAIQWSPVPWNHSLCTLCILCILCTVFGIYWMYLGGFGMFLDSSWLPSHCHDAKTAEAWWRRARHSFARLRTRECSLCRVLLTAWPTSCLLENILCLGLNILNAFQGLKASKCFRTG